jgi:hypothetical protein
MSYRELGLLSILLIWSAFAFLLYKWRGKRTMSLSLHAASARSAFYYFATMLIIAGILFYIFMLQWFIPALGLPFSFTLIISLMTVLTVLTALIPDTRGLLQLLHRITAYSIAVFMFIVIIFILASCSVHLVAQIIGGAALSYMAFTMIVYPRARKYPKHFLVRNYLPLQVAYIVSFHLFILAVTYLQ